MGDLTGKQLAWANAYLETYNKTEAARRAGYQGNDVTLGAIGYENFKKPQIQEYISQRLTESAMSSDEALKRLGDMARADIADFATLERIADLKDEEYKGKSHVIKKFKRKITRDIKNDTEYEEIEIELYPADMQLERIGKHHGLFNNDAGSSEKNPFVLKVVYGNRTNNTTSEPPPEAD